MSAITGCPVCRSPRIVSVVGPARRAFCTRCGARWTRDGGAQVAVQPPSDSLLHLILGLSGRKEAPA